MIPAVKYGGTERVVWGLGKALSRMGHGVYYLARKGAYSPFAKAMYAYDPAKDLDDQIPDFIDVVHLHFFRKPLKKPYVYTLHGNCGDERTLDKNTVFISKNHADRHHGNVFVYNGLDWDEYDRPGRDARREYLHFLGNAAWKVKNVKGAIEIARQAGEKLYVLGGCRLNLKMGIRFYPDLHVRFKGMVDNRKKSRYLQSSGGLLFPVLWHEPFGLAIIESLYFGCPVFGTPYGSLPELVTKETGFLSNSKSELAKAIKASDYNRQYCHDYAVSEFCSSVMAGRYVSLYEKVLNGESLHLSHPYSQKNNETLLTMAD